MTAQLLRTLVIFLAPLSYLVIGIVHPADVALGDDPDFYIGLHIFQLFSIWGMALMLWFLTEGVDNKAARLARGAILPYAIFYTAFDVIAGVAMGVIVHIANGAAPADQAAMVRFMDDLNGHWIGYPLYFASGLSWLIAAGATVVSLKGTVHSGALILLFVGTVIFTVGHPFPPGPVGMTLFIAGLVWLQLGRRSAAAEAPAQRATQTIDAAVLS